MGALFTIIAVLVTLVTVVVVGRNVLENTKTNNALSELETIRTNVISSFPGPNFTGLTNAYAEKAGIFPSNMIAGAVGAGNDVDPWAGTVSIAANATTSMFDVTFNNVPQDACIAMAQYVSSDLAALKINATAQTLPETAPAAAGACTSTPNTLVFTFAG